MNKRKLFIELGELNLPYWRIAKALGSHHTTVSKTLKQLPTQDYSWEEIKQMYVDQRISARKISRQLQLPWTMVRRILIRQGVWRGKNSIPTSEYPRIAHLHIKEEIPMTEIAKRYKVSASAVRLALVRYGVLR